MSMLNSSRRRSGVYHRPGAQPAREDRVVIWEAARR